MIKIESNIEILRGYNLHQYLRNYIKASKYLDSYEPIKKLSDMVTDDINSMDANTLIINTIKSLDDCDDISLDTVVAFSNYVLLHDKNKKELQEEKLIPYLDEVKGDLKLTTVINHLNKLDSLGVEKVFITDKREQGLFIQANLS